MTHARLFLLAAAFMFAAACGGEDTSSDANTDTGPDVPTECVGCGAPYEATFVISTLHIGNTDQGFNLDGEYTQCTDGSCIVDGNNGVDNRLSEILEAVENAINEPLNADEEIDQNILDGDMLVLLRLMDVEVTNMASITSADPNVQVKGYMGVDTDDPEDPSDNLDGTEPFDVDTRSLTNPTDAESSLIHFTQCNINAGKLRCNPSLFRLDITISDAQLNLSVHDSQVVCTISTAPTDDGSGDYVGGRMRECILGGYVPIQYLQDALDDFAGSLGDIQPSQIQQILANHADMDSVPEGATTTSCTSGEDCLSWQECRVDTCFEPADQNDSISLAVVFEAVSAVFTGTPVVVE